MFFSSSNFIRVVILASLVTGSSFLVQADSRPFYKYSLSLLDTKVPNLQESIRHYGSPESASQFGAILAKADLNHDGLDDLIVGSPYYSTDGKKDRGRVEVYFGRKDFFSFMSQATDQPDIDVLGSEAGSQLGTAVTSGDINGDMVDDLIVGSPGNGTVSILFGNGNLTVPHLYDLSQRSADWTLRSGDHTEQFGFALDTADLDGDHIDDILVGAPFASKNSLKRAGKVYGIYGMTQPPLSRDTYISSSRTDLLWWGEAEDDRFGITLAHGDIDGDKLPDIAVGSYMATSGGSKQAGNVTLLQGSRLKNRNSTSEDSVKVHEEDAEGTDAGTGTGAAPAGALGSAAAAATDAGVASVLATDRGFDWFGYSLTFGDLNNDGLDDLIMSDFPYLKNTKQGQIYILWGQKNGSFKDKTLSRVIAPDETALLGSSLGIYDINHDGVLDLVIGGATTAPGSDRHFGKIYALNFFPRNKELWNFSKVPADMMIEGRSEDDWFGNSFIFGDFDSDGNPDMVAGAPNSRLNTIATGSIELLAGPIVPHGDLSYTLPSPSEALSRGSFIVRVINALKLQQTNKEFISSCLANAEFCFYQFSSQTKYAGLRYSPILRLYPDVKPIDPYYKAVNIATILGIVRGFPDEPDSPFHPEKPISRIHALKILLTATGMLPWKEQFELRKELLKSQVADRRTTVGRDTRAKNPITSQKTPYLDISAYVPSMWWYPRYVNFAYLSGIINDSVFFQPDAPLTQKDFEQWMDHIQEYISRHQ